MARTRKTNGEGAAIKPRASTPTAMARPTNEQIRVRAYQIYLERGPRPGNADTDWLQAERELLAGPAAGAASKPKSGPAATSSPQVARRSQPGAAARQ
jgi:hypothetical protein